MTPDVFRILGDFGIQTLPEPTHNSLTVLSPFNGEQMAIIPTDTPGTINAKLEIMSDAQVEWTNTPIEVRKDFLEVFSAQVKEHAADLAKLGSLESGKFIAETAGETNVIQNTIKPTLASIIPEEDRDLEVPGIVATIPSYNFPIGVASWSYAPALAAGNAVILKPSEEVPLSGLAIKYVFDEAVDTFNANSDHRVSKDIFQVVTGARDVGQAVVKNPLVNMVSATGSVQMGQAVKKTLEEKPGGTLYSPILELGGNNAIVISFYVGSQSFEDIAGYIAESVFDNLFVNSPKLSRRSI